MNNIKKIVVSPQIVIYKKVIDFNDEIINLINTVQNDSVFKNWEDWYSQGSRMSSFLNKKNREDSKNYIMLEKIADSFQEIIDDYINDFGSHKYRWPEFIKNWELIEKNRDEYKIDFFKYDYKKLKNKMNRENTLLLDYHVDEFDFDNIQGRKKNIVTINMYLNDDYEEGEVCIYEDINKKIYKYKPEAGDVLIMPSASPFYHAVKNFYNKDRYFCRIFISYLNTTEEFNSEVAKKILLTEDNLIKNNLQIIKITGEEIEIGK